MAAKELPDTVPVEPIVSTKMRGEPPRSTVLPRFERQGDELTPVQERRVRYEPRRVVGEGGMGEVWLAHDNDIGRSVAVKRLRTEAAGPGGLSRFVDEVRIAGRLEHPNIPPLHDVGVDEAGRPYFVMKLVEGVSLDQIIARLQSGDPRSVEDWPVERRVEVVRGILSALGYAHQRGLVHRDVKPANVMIGNNGEIVLTDWGIARGADQDLDTAPEDLPRDSLVRVTPVTQDGRIVGTPMYMAPEQAGAFDDEGLDGRADLYAAGVILHELLTLRHYMRDVPGTAELVARLYDPRPPSLMDMAKTHPSADRVPAEYLHIARKAMQKQPSLRYQTAGEMLAALDAVREGRMPVSCHATLTKRSLMGLARWVDRSHFVAPAILWLGALGLAVGTAYGLWALLSGST